MNRTNKIYLTLLVLVMALVTFLEMNKTPVIDWSLNYDTQKKTPFGLYIFDQEADSLFPKGLERIAEDPYLYLEKDSLREPQNYISIQKYYTEEGLNYLLKEVEKGSSAFIIDDYLFDLIDTLNYEISSYYSNNDSATFRFTDSKLWQDSLIIHKNFNTTYFSYINPETTSILGYMDEEMPYIDEDNAQYQTKFIQVSYGKGMFYLLLQPQMLTNYYLKEKENQKAIEALFSYLPNRKTVWFQDETFGMKSSSPFRFILQNPPLRYAWYLIVFGLITFMFFNAKRRQRIIPIIEPPVNKSVEFVKSIGNLYLQEGNDKDMAQKKVVYFLNKVRNDLYLNTDTLDEEFAKKLQIKTSKNKEDIDKAIQLMKKAMHTQAPFHQKELVELNELLDKIYS